MVICPEGTSTSTERSPVPFRTGAFRLAAYVRPEPWIIPIAVAHFDKKITRTKVVAVVHSPFRLSDFVPDSEEPKAIPKFTEEEYRRFQQYVKEAVALGGPLL